MISARSGIKMEPRFALDAKLRQIVLRLRSGGLELGRQVAIDFQPDADLDQRGSRPGHVRSHLVNPRQRRSACLSVNSITSNGLGSSIGSIKRVMIQKISGRVAYAVMSFDGS
jgi:hypothetical protein